MRIEGEEKVNSMCSVEAWSLNEGSIFMDEIEIIIKLAINLYMKGRRYWKLSLKIDNYKFCGKRESFGIIHIQWRKMR